MFRDLSVGGGGGGGGGVVDELPPPQFNAPTAPARMEAKQTALKICEARRDIFVRGCFCRESVSKLIGEER
jgi:hypothetical protein